MLERKAPEIRAGFVNIVVRIEQDVTSWHIRRRKIETDKMMIQTKVTLWQNETPVISVIFLKMFRHP